MTHSEVLNQIYERALNKVAENDFEYDLPSDIVGMISALVDGSERNKGVITVLITLFAHKIVDPAQDIRYHQAKFENGFAG